MGLITRCPACGTMFKVVADQLRISEGWVRCGHCAEIFDATADLRDEAQLDQMTAPAPIEPEHMPAPLPDEALVEDDASSGYPFSVHSEVPSGAIEGTPDAIEIEEQVHALHEHPLDQPFELRRADVREGEPVGPHGFSQPMPLQQEPELHDVGFVRQAQRREFWARRSVRAVLSLVLLVFATLLAGQVAYQDRDRVAAAHPALRPWLARMCDVMRCQLGPPHLIDSVAIETSAFNKLRGDTYRLSVTLRNVATTPVAMPALELTLTDSQDQPVLRRVLQAGEFAPGAPAIAPVADWSGAVALSVNPAAAGGRISGYRVLAFYP